MSTWVGGQACYWKAALHSLGESFPSRPGGPELWLFQVVAEAGTILTFRRCHGKNCSLGMLEVRRLGLLVVLALGTLDSRMLVSPSALPYGTGWRLSNTPGPSHLLLSHSTSPEREALAVPSARGWPPGWVAVSPSAFPDNSSQGLGEPSQPCPSLASTGPAVRWQDRDRKISGISRRKNVLFSPLSQHPHP